MVVCRKGVLILCAVAAASCADAEAPISRNAQRDSAGITIVEVNEIPAQWEAAHATTIGQLEGPPEYTFNNIADLQLSPSGDVVILDSGDNIVKVFDAEGVFQYSLGGEGDGPSEFQGSAKLIWQADTLLVYDFTGPKLVRFHGQDFIDTQRTELTPFAYGFPESWQPIPGGWLVALSTGCSLPRPEELRPFWKLLTLSEDASIADTVALLPKADILAIYGERFCTGAETVAGPAHLLSVRPDGRTAYGDGQTYAIRFFDLEAQPAAGFDGTLPRSDMILRRERTEIPVTDATIGRYRDAILTPSEGRIPDQDRITAFEAAWDTVGFATHYPYFDTLLWDDEGWLWVGEGWTDPSSLGPGETKTWAVFSDSGRHLADVTLPADLTVRAIQGEWIWGTTQDELGVTYVMGYRLES